MRKGAPLALSIASALLLALAGAWLSVQILNRIFNIDTAAAERTTVLFYLLLGGLPLSVYGTMMIERITARKDRPVRGLVYPSVSIVVPAYNAEKTIGATLRSVLAQEYPEELLEVIVVDDGSSDATLAVAEWYSMRDHRIRVISHGVNLGKPAALTTGIREAGGDVIVTVDSDTVLDRKALASLVSSLYLGEGVGGVSGRVLPASPGGGVLARLQEIEYFLSFDVGRFVQSTLHRVNLVLSGALSAFRGRHLKSSGRLGVPDDTLAEDFELTVLLWKRGYSTGYADGAVGYTEVPSSFSGLVRQRLRWFAGGLQVLFKHRQLLRRGVFSRVLTFYMLLLEVVFPVLHVAGYALIATLIPASLLVPDILSLPLPVVGKAYASALTASIGVSALLSSATMVAVNGLSWAVRRVPYLLLYETFYTTLLSIVKVEALVRMASKARVGW